MTWHGTEPLDKPFMPAGSCTLVVDWSDGALRGGGLTGTLVKDDNRPTTLMHPTSDGVGLGLRNAPR